MSDNGARGGAGDADMRPTSSADTRATGDADMRAARVRAVVAIGERLADGRDALGREARERLPEVTGLSAEGVELALSEHLETRVSEEELGRLIERAGRARRCVVVLSANVCTGALRAIAFATATAAEVRVKASRRDPVVAELIVRALSVEEAFGAAGGSATLVSQVEASAGDEVHVYGADATIEAIAAGLDREVTLRGHGAGLGLSVIEEGADAKADAEALARDVAALARDVVAFDQRGCLSPRVLMVAGGSARAIEVAEALSGALARAEERVPRGRIEGAVRAEIARYVGTAAALGAVFEGPGHVVGVDMEPRELVVPPAARVVHVVPVRGDEIARLVRALRGAVTTVGASDGGTARTEGAITRALRDALPPGVRFTRLGQMQRPPLDGPVDLRRVERG
ncbi:MAG: acyl-CoA reductase [Polyangiaceae bacterium]